jgi:transposase
MGRLSSVAWLLLQEEDKRSVDEQRLWRQLQQDSELVQMQALVQQGREMIRPRPPGALAAWWQAGQSSWIAALKHLIKVRQPDEEAVKAALTLPWSTAPVAGHLNRLKLSKGSG